MQCRGSLSIDLYQKDPLETHLWAKIHLTQKGNLNSPPSVSLPTCTTLCIAYSFILDFYKFGHFVTRACYQVIFLSSWLK